MKLNVPNHFHIEVDFKEKKAQLRTSGWWQSGLLNDAPFDLTILPANGNVLAGPTPDSILIAVELAVMRTQPQAPDPQIIIP